MIRWIRALRKLQSDVRAALALPFEHEERVNPYLGWMEKAEEE